MVLLRLPKTIDLDTRPARTAFVEHFAEQLLLRQQSKAQIQPRMNALRWFLSSTEKPPHEITRDEYLAFMTKAVSMGARAARLSGLRFAIHLAFDQMCGRKIVSLPLKTEPLEPKGRPVGNMSRGRIIAVLADELGIEPREVQTLDWRHISFTDQLITLPSPYGSRQRRIALTKRAHELLIELRRIAPAQGELFGPKELGGADQKADGASIKPRARRAADGASSVSSSPAASA